MIAVAKTFDAIESAAKLLSRQNHWPRGRLAGVLLAMMANPALAAGDQLDVPSGLLVTFHEAITDQPGQGLTYRFRFIAPSIARENGQMDYEVIEADMAHLCQSFALPRIPLTGPKPNQIVISIADRPTGFGMVEPDATQFFEAYSIDGDNCMWEPF